VSPVSPEPIADTPIGYNAVVTITAVGPSLYPEPDDRECYLYRNSDLVRVIMPGRMIDLSCNIGDTLTAEWMETRTSTTLQVHSAGMRVTTNKSYWVLD
jgi:hypothetical protein